ncbi:MAG: adenylyltransferase/cytidyltransferase family protein [Oscillospiraceae bacterium]|nr:adenylyltransferase/cytidyltransferase family protein [Oscillospiraceae bacterium]
MKKYKIGYTAGAFDLFHIGHLNLLMRAKEACEYLIVAVSTDELICEYKNKKPFIPFSERKAIVESIKYVDKVVVQENRNKTAAFEKYKFDAMFVGDDWKGDDLFKETENFLLARNSCIVYLPYTKNISSSKLKQIIDELL